MHDNTFDSLYKAHFRQVYEYVYYRVHHRETAEDLTTVTFMKALENFESFDDRKASFRTWVSRIARNAVIDHWRKLKPETDIEDVWDALRDGSDIARDVDARLRLEKLEKAMTGLTPEQRDIIIMRVWDGLSHAEIAAVLGKKEDAVKMSFSRAIGALRKNAPLALIIFYLIAK